MKKILYALIALIAVLSAFFLINIRFSKPELNEYGVFIGIEAEDIKRLDSYKTVVIEPSLFDKALIERLHQNGKTVYGYLNIGSLENYRSYYKDFKRLALGRYENWDDEEWIDVSDKDWQEFISLKIAKEYADKGIDGFFIDNADVYYHYNQPEIFEGLCAILKNLKTYNLTIIINGGDSFVSECISKNIHGSLFDAVNQESVFTKIDFENMKYYEQDKDTLKYFLEYLELVKDNGIKVYLLEYGADKATAKKINSYCRENGFLWYNAENIFLE